MSQPNSTPNLNKTQRYLFQLQKLLDAARRIGKPSIIFALQKLIAKRGRE